MTYRFERSTKEDAAEIMERLDKEIVAQLYDFRPFDTEEMIVDLIESSEEAWSVFNDTGILVIFGIIRPSLLTDKGWPWLISSTEIGKHKRNLMKGCVIVVEYWLKQYSVLENYIPTGFSRFLRWAEWNGFTVHEPVHGTGGRLFHRVEKRR